MIKTITLGGQPVEINSSMGWLYLYRNQFGHDILPDVMPLIEAVVAGIGDYYSVAARDGELDAKDVVDLMNSDAIVEMFIKLAGLEFTTLLNIFWALAKNGNRKIPAPEEFVNGFDRLPIDELAPALLYVIVDSSVSSKNAKSLLPRLEKATRSVLTESQSPESTEG